MLPRQTKRTETGLGEVESLIVTAVGSRMVCEDLWSGFGGVRVLDVEV